MRVRTSIRKPGGSDKSADVHRPTLGGRQELPALTTTRSWALVAVLKKSTGVRVSWLLLQSCEQSERFPQAAARPCGPPKGHPAQGVGMDRTSPGWLRVDRAQIQTAARHCEHPSEDSTAVRGRTARTTQACRAASESASQVLAERPSLPPTGFERSSVSGLPMLLRQSGHHTRRRSVTGMRVHERPVSWQRSASGPGRPGRAERPFQWGRSTGGSVIASTTRQPPRPCGPVHLRRGRTADTVAERARRQWRRWRSPSSKPLTRPAAPDPSHHLRSRRTAHAKATERSPSGGGGVRSFSIPDH